MVSEPKSYCIKNKPIRRYNSAGRFDPVYVTEEGPAICTFPAINYIWGSRIITIFCLKYPTREPTAGITGHMGR